MADYDNNMRGVLFKNKDKEKENHPDYKGSCEIDGREFWLSAWINTPKKGGDKFMSIAFKDKDENNSEDYNHPSPDDNDVPF